MHQPIPKGITDANPDYALRPFTTLLVDGSNLLEVCFRADKRISANGRNTGAIYQFFLQLKLLLRKGNFRYCYVFFDGDNSGELRYRECVDYKANRDKTFEPEELSDYMKAFNATMKTWTEKATKKKREESDRENFFWQRDVVISMCEELFIRTIMCDKTEADDLIAWYVKNKKKEERIVICTNDRDLTQLIHRQEGCDKDDVIVYIQKLHEFINTKNHTKVIGYHYTNVLLKKMLCGDSSDNIKGVKGFGETRLMSFFPEIKERKVTLDEVIARAKTLNEGRVSNKKKPLQWAENIEKGITEGCQAGHLYDINEKIIDLTNPLMPEEAKSAIEEFMYAPLDKEGRSIENLYAIVTEAGVDEWRDANSFGFFFSEFNSLIDKEKSNTI